MTFDQQRLAPYLKPLTENRVRPAHQPASPAGFVADLSYVFGTSLVMITTILALTATVDSDTGGCRLRFAEDGFRFSALDLGCLATWCFTPNLLRDVFDVDGHTAETVGFSMVCGPAPLFAALVPLELAWRGLGYGRDQILDPTRFAAGCCAIITCAAMTAIYFATPSNAVAVPRQASDAAGVDLEPRSQEHFRACAANYYASGKSLDRTAAHPARRRVSGLFDGFDGPENLDELLTIAAETQTQPIEVKSYVDVGRILSRE